MLQRYIFISKIPKVSTKIVINQEFRNSLTCIKKRYCFRTQSIKIHCRMKKTPYLCTVKRNKKPCDTG